MQLNALIDNTRRPDPKVDQVGLDRDPGWLGHRLDSIEEVVGLVAEMVQGAMLEHLRTGADQFRYAIGGRQQQEQLCRAPLEPFSRSDRPRRRPRRRRCPALAVEVRSPSTAISHRWRLRQIS